MKRDQVIAELRATRAIFDEKVAAVPPEALDIPVPGSAHSAKDIVAHVSAYDDLIVQRLVAARHGATTAFDRDRSGWEAFNDRTWREAADLKADVVLHRAADVFSALLHEVGQLSDEELDSAVGATASLDPAWLEGEPPWRLIKTDAFGHYPMHYEALDAAAGAARS
ncbi:MAG TPA: DinB family protein [Coriobacteriia bacterium]